MSDDNNNKNNNNKDDKKFNPFGEFNKLGGSGGGPQNKFMRNMMLWLIIAAGIFSIYIITQTNQKPEWPVSYTKYKKFLEQELIKDAVIKKSQLNDFEFHGELKEPVSVMIDGRPRTIRFFVTKLGVVSQETEEMWESKGITWTYKEGDTNWWGAILSVLPWILLIGLYFLFIRRMQGGGGGSKGIFSFGKSKARMFDEKQSDITFRDVAGADEAKYELEEIIEFLKEPSKFQKLGGKIPRGVLLLGPPGTGKTLLARAVAGEAGVPFFSISGADFVEMFVGVGASRVRDLFEQAKKNSPCLVFIDEMDAVGRQRGAGLGGGHDEREQTLNQLLVEMDGFEQNSGVIIIAATNRPDVLDPALLRPGRFDRQVVVDRPDVKGREGIFKVHVKKIPLGDDVDLEILARGTPGLSGADIANIVNESALLAARRNSDKVTMYDFESAKDKVLMGIERKSLVISEKEKEMTAYHEIGHALMGKFLKNADPVHKVTIIPRGRALGVTASLPLEEFHTYSQQYLQARIITLMGGRAAEKIVFDNLTSGAANDIERATKIARKMVCDFGMSKSLGPINYNSNDEEVFLGKEIAQNRNHSEKTAQQIDKEVRRIVSEANSRAENMLNENIDLLHNTAKILLEREVLNSEELDMIIRGEDLPPLSKETLNAIKSMKFNGGNETDNNENEESDINNSPGKDEE
jgi:cell division protease FtsH